MQDAKISTTHPARPAAAVCNKQKINLPIKQSKKNKPKYPVANLIIINHMCLSVLTSSYDKNRKKMKVEIVCVVLFLSCSRCECILCVKTTIQLAFKLSAADQSNNDD